jgi:hypothetical protein
MFQHNLHSSCCFIVIYYCDQIVVITIVATTIVATTIVATTIVATTTVATLVIPFLPPWN